MKTSNVNNEEKNVHHRLYLNEPRQLSQPKEIFSRPDGQKENKFALQSNPFV